MCSLLHKPHLFIQIQHRFILNNLINLRMAYVRPKHVLFIYPFHPPTNGLLINLVKSFKFTLKHTIISLPRVSVFNDLTKVIFMLKHSAKLRRYIYIYIYIYKLGHVAACRRVACVLYTTHMPLYNMLQH